MFVLNIRGLVLTDGRFEFHMFFNYRNQLNCYPFPFESGPNSLLTLLLRYVKPSAAARDSPSSKICLMLCFSSCMFQDLMLRKLLLQWFSPSEFVDVYSIEEQGHL